MLPSCIEFGKRVIQNNDIAGKAVIEIGALDVNGSLRPYVESFTPAKYVGIDITSGKGVDIICDASRTVHTFGEGSFDVAISTELLEHVQDWRTVISNIKQVVRKGGIIIITTRSIGFGHHGFPYDYWRYEQRDIKDIFADCSIDILENDPSYPGIFLKARKPDTFVEKDLSGISLYSMIRRRRVKNITGVDEFIFSVRSKIHILMWSVTPLFLRNIYEKHKARKNAKQISIYK